MGWGFQIPFPIIKNLDIFKLRKGRIRLYWNMAPHGFKVEFPFKGVNIIFTGDVAPPSDTYQTALAALGDLELAIQEPDGHPALGFRIKEQYQNNDVHFDIRTVLQKNGLIWNSDLERKGYRSVGQSDQHYTIIDELGRFRPGEKYNYSVAYLDEIPAIIYEYQFRMPADFQNLEPGTRIPCQVERVRKFSVFND